jgi:hypothetical protein
MRGLPAAPSTELASAARWTAVFALDAAVITLVLLRFHVAPLMPSLVALAGSLFVSVLAMVLAIAAFVVIWRKGVHGFGRALTAFILALFLMLPAGMAIFVAMTTPNIVDISTDGADPPALVFAAKNRPPDANPVAYDSANVARQQEDFPQIQSMLVDIPADDIRKLILRLIKERNWQLVSDMRLAETAARVRLPAVAPADRIEAVASSRLLGTVDDISIRLRTEGGQTRIDMRAAARFGSFDFGANASNVQHFMADLRHLALLPDQTNQ